MKLPQRSPKRAFTLIELLVVISIIGVLITLVTVTVLPVQRKSRDARRKADVNLFLSGIGLFNADYKVYPNYTFFLGTNSSEPGATNSNFGLENEIPTCNSNTLGATSQFAEPNTGSWTGATTIKLKAGFASVNNFLICLKYLDKLVQDPSATLNVDKYHYRVNYDYSEFLVGAKLENTNDPDAKMLYSVLADKRYWVGNGSNSRQLADDSDTTLVYGDTISASAGSADDGQYFYQCMRSGDGGAGADVLMTINPFKLSGSTWVANIGLSATTCTMNGQSSVSRASF